MKIPDNVKAIMKELILMGYEAYIVGGAVRDYLLGVEPHDYDIFTNATGEDILRIFPQGKVLGGEERQKKILTVIVEGVEVSQYRSNGDRTETGNNLKEHINTCDFTINAIACDIDGKIIDYVGGQKHLAYKIICFVGNPSNRIMEDPLRILRAVRFSAKYKFNLNNDAFYRIQNYLHMLDTLPGERIKEELGKIIVYSKSISTMKELSILNHLFPEFVYVYNMTGGDKHNELVIEHLEEAFKTACSVTDDFKLRFAALFHDIGKGVTKQYEYSNSPVDMPEMIGVTFYGHEEEGEKIFLKYADKYKFSNDETKFISFLIRNHMFGYHCLEELNNKTLIKFFNKMEAAGVTIMDFVTILYCDHQGNLAKPRIKFKDFVEGNFFYNKYHSLKKTQPFKVSDLEINGNDLIKMGYKGKDIGVKLNELFDKVLDGELINRRDRLMEVLLK